MDLLLFKYFNFLWGNQRMTTNRKAPLSDLADHKDKGTPKSQIQFTTNTDFSQAWHGCQSLIIARCFLQALTGVLNAPHAQTHRWEVRHD